MLSRLSSFSGPLSKLFNAIKGFTLNGLILRYEISDTNSYSGSNTVTDLVSNSNATLTNGPTYSINGYINFDGANDYLLTNTSLNSKLSPANTSSVISHFIWIYPTDNGVIVSEQGNPPLNSGWHDSQIEIVAGNLKFGLWQTGGGVSSLNSSISTPFYNWYYVGLTYDGSIMRGYVNGQLAGSKSVSRWTPYNNGGGVGLNYAIAAADNTINKWVVSSIDITDISNDNNNDDWISKDDIIDKLSDNISFINNKMNKKIIEMQKYINELEENKLNINKIFLELKASPSKNIQEPLNKINQLIICQESKINI